jgi:hypothetical protein
MNIVNNIPEISTVNTAIKIGWWVSIIAIIIALILIIVSMIEFSKKNNSYGTGLLITGGILGCLGGVGYHYTSKNLTSIISSTIFGKGEETVKDVCDECCVGGKDYEEFSDEINELDYVESSDENDENPFEHDNEEMEESQHKNLEDNIKNQ